MWHTSLFSFQSVSVMIHSMLASIKHNSALSGDRRAAIICPADLTKKEGERLKALIDILVTEPSEGGNA